MQLPSGMGGSEQCLNAVPRARFASLVDYDGDDDARAANGQRKPPAAAEQTAYTLGWERARWMGRSAGTGVRRASLCRCVCGHDARHRWRRRRDSEEQADGASGIPWCRLSGRPGLAPVCTGMIIQPARYPPWHVGGTSAASREDGWCYTYTMGSSSSSALACGEGAAR